MVDNDCAFSIVVGDFRERLQAEVDTFCQVFQQPPSVESIFWNAPQLNTWFHKHSANEFILKEYLKTRKSDAKARSLKFKQSHT
jgi:hypothetical protein